MKKVIILFTALLMIQWGSAQNPPQKGDGIIKAKAKELTKKYAAELGLESGQLADFEQTLTGYMLKKDKVGKMNLSKADKAVMLKQLIGQENEDMAALLHKGQYKKYLKAKMKLQP
ncbi:hypothetical protein [Maribacter polysaccharolyticus]|uniref:hypothetical protein n=1 Tax=Maribacter polysaccharolyticus TaxID=3020831 RepID=UPI00237F4F1C|nr:hypothetical protein [Maribacter polysaccharolyticus]MDE3740538.1 hypothetical protein [Maribacter polysaccharolyticus]